MNADGCARNAQAAYSLHLTSVMASLVLAATRNEAVEDTARQRRNAGGRTIVSETDQAQPT